MIKLLAKSQVDGRYYFTEDEETVYMIKSPLAEAQKEFVDALPVFLEKSFNSGLVYDDQEFQNFEELRAFAISDSAPEKRGVELPKINSKRQPSELFNDICKYDKEVQSLKPLIDDLWDAIKLVGAHNIDYICVFLKNLQNHYLYIHSLTSVLFNEAVIIANDYPCAPPMIYKWPPKLHTLLETLNNDIKDILKNKGMEDESIEKPSSSTNPHIQGTEDSSVGCIQETR